MNSDALMQNSSARMLCAGLSVDGWTLRAAGDGTLAIVPKAGMWPQAPDYPPRITSRRLSRRSDAWWVWEAPAAIAGIRICPVYSGRASRLIVGTLGKPANQVWKSES